MQARVSAENRKGNVPHLRRLICHWIAYPALTGWANSCHTYGAKTKGQVREAKSDASFSSMAEAAAG